MADQPSRGVAFEAEDAQAGELWDALGRIEQAEPPARLRSGFYRRLAALPETPLWWSALRRWFGHPLLPATAMLIVGILAGRALQAPAGGDDLRALRQEVALLHRDVALSLMHNQSASERLKGVLSAADWASDTEVARALLRQAADDPSRAVRAAAIDALGPRVQAPGVGEEVLRLLADSSSPLVQKALVDLILRHGNGAQLEALLGLAQRQALYPDLSAYVSKTIRRTGA